MSTHREPAEAADSLPPAYAVFLTRSVSHAMKGEAALTGAGIGNKLIPVPRALSSQCGVCLRIGVADRAQAEQALRAAGLEISAIHDLPETPRNKEAEGERPAAGR
jgi:hypothetical protein